MKRLAEFFQTEDWKKEKHVAVIEIPDNERAFPPVMIEKSKRNKDYDYHSQKKEINVVSDTPQVRQGTERGY